MTDAAPAGTVGMTTIVRCHVLYFGSAVPMETSVGLEAFKAPLRQLYAVTDDHVTSIEAELAVHGAGIQMLYSNDDTASVWFPIQTLHACAALNAFKTSAGELDFVTVDCFPSGTVHRSSIFAFISRRRKGIKVLECHMFVCKSVAEATALVQACAHAYEDEKGWLEDAETWKHYSMPRLFPAAEGDVFLTPTQGGKIIPAHETTASSHVPVSGFSHINRPELIKKYNIYGKEEVGERKWDGGNQQTTSGDKSKLPAEKKSRKTAQQKESAVPGGYFSEWNRNAPSFHPSDKVEKQSKASKPSKSRGKSKSKDGSDVTDERTKVVEYYYVRPTRTAGYQSPVTYTPGSEARILTNRAVPYYNYDQYAQGTPRSGVDPYYYEGYAMPGIRETPHFPRYPERYAERAPRTGGWVESPYFAVPWYGQTGVVPKAARESVLVYRPENLDAGREPRNITRTEQNHAKNPQTFNTRVLHHDVSTGVTMATNAGRREPGSSAVSSRNELQNTDSSEKTKESRYLKEATNSASLYGPLLPKAASAETQHEPEPDYPMDEPRVGAVYFTPF